MNNELLDWFISQMRFILQQWCSEDFIIGFLLLTHVFQMWLPQILGLWVTCPCMLSFQNRIKRYTPPLLLVAVLLNVHWGSFLLVLVSRTMLGRPHMKMGPGRVLFQINSKWNGNYEYMRVITFSCLQFKLFSYSLAYSGWQSLAVQILIIIFGRCVAMATCPCF